MKISIIQAIDLLSNGGVVALPTDTVYGVAASLDSPEAIKHLFDLKGRSHKKPLIVMIAEGKQCIPFLKTPLPHNLNEVIERYWPGPLTLVMEVLQERIPVEVRAGLATAGFRVPQDPQALEVLAAVGPCVVTSANLSDNPSSITAEVVEGEFGEEFPVIDGGRSPRGRASTILAWQEGEWKELRSGEVSVAEVRKCVAS